MLFASHLMLLAALLAAPEDAAKQENRWEKNIRAFEEQDKNTPPAKDAVLFVGSSSIRMWDLSKFFPALPALNRGFGGSTVADVNLFFDRVVKPYAPATIVFYSGDNDLASGKEPKDVLEDFRLFFEKVHNSFPSAQLLILSLRPTLARWNLFDKQTQVNDGLAEMAKANEQVIFLNCNDILLDSAGQPREDFLLQDKLHLNEAGYTAWTERLRPSLEQPQPKP